MHFIIIDMKFIIVLPAIAFFLVTMVAVGSTPESFSLPQTELTKFTSRIHTEQNTDIQGTVTISPKGYTEHRLTSNGIPDHDTDTFPGLTNPNSILLQSYYVNIPKFPVIVTEPICLPSNTPIAFAKNGIPIFSPYNSNGENVVEGQNSERFDVCDGHPNKTGKYHYHQTPDCLYAGGNDEFIGVALDGFPIYGAKDRNGNELESSDLDACHGRTENGEYRYRLTRDAPYVMGCFKGTPSSDIPSKVLLDSSCKIS